jgi:hypothetical protein
MSEDFEVIGTIDEIQTIATGSRIREIVRLRKAFGPGRWRKLKGIAYVKFEDGTIHRVELHWYEAHGIGRKKLKSRNILISDYGSSDSNTFIRPMH